MLSVMSTTLSRRKPVSKLKITDFRDFPVWEYAIDEEGKPGQDETWVRPVNHQLVRKGVYSQIVAASFTTASGRSLRGFMIVNTAEGKIEILPGVILGRVGYQPMPTMSRKFAARRHFDWAIQMRNQLVRRLGEAESKVFPIRYSLLVPFRGEKNLRKGTIK
jgi:hypothetical protein